MARRDQANLEQIQQVRLVPKADHYVVEVMYQAAAKHAKGVKKLFVALDPGVLVLAALPPTSQASLPVWFQRPP